MYKIVICIIFWTTFTSFQNKESSLIAISANSHGALESGIGIEITLTNIESKIKYKSKPLSKFSSHSIIQEIPSGQYIVTQVEIPLGQFKFINSSQELSDYFGVINIEPNQKYYMGNFVGERKAGKKNVFYLSIENEEIPKKLIEKLQKKNLIQATPNIKKTYPYNNEKLLIY